MTEMKTLHFTLGPVQGFVAQARRTRDLWAGSFLLSYLTGQAMMAVLNSGGSIKFPQVVDGTGRITDPLLRAIAGASSGNLRTGSLPNRFKAEVPIEFDPDQCRWAVMGAWTKIAQAVWNKYVEPVANLGADTPQIWERQVSQFWDIAWVISPSDSSVVRRKNWRTYCPPSEQGEMCSMMPSLQEISGHWRTHADGRHKQEMFWESLRERGDLGGNEIQADKRERLSAVALIKRLFPLVSKEALGWRMTDHYPSTVYFSSSDWIVRQVKNVPRQAAEYSRVVRKLEGQTPLPRQDIANGLRQMVLGDDDLETFARLDSNWFQTSFLEQLDGSNKSISTVRALLKKFQGQAGTYYALLVMDGDRLGKLLQTIGGENVSQALSQFTLDVDDLVEQHYGRTIYAGGDDVLAMFPLSHVIEAAQALRMRYREAFAQCEGGQGATISAGIVFAHYHAPLQAIIRHGHTVLDQFAKARVGRDGIALSTWNSGGVAVAWAAKWHAVVAPDGTSRILQVVDRMEREDHATQEVSSSFLYKVRDIVGRLGDDASSVVTTRHVLEDLLKAEFRRSRSATQGSAEDVQIIEDLMEMAGDSHGQTFGENLSSAALIIRFLASQGGRSI